MTGDAVKTRTTGTVGDTLVLPDVVATPADLAAKALGAPSEASAAEFLSAIASRPEAEKKQAFAALLAGLGKQPAAERAFVTALKAAFVKASPETRKLLGPFLKDADAKIVKAEKAARAKAESIDAKASGPTTTSALASEPALAVGLRGGKISEAHNVAGPIAARCSGYTSAANETLIANDIRAYVGTGPDAPARARALLDAMKAQNPKIDLARLVDELENPAERQQILDLLLPAASAEEKAGAIQQLTGNWFWQLLMALFAFKDDRATVHQIVKSCFGKDEPDGVGPKSTENLRALFAESMKVGVSFETIYDALPEQKGPREQVVLAAASSMTIDQRAHAIAVLVHGYTPADKERAIGVFLAKAPPTERKALMLALEREQKINYGEVDGELDDKGRAFLRSHYLAPDALQKFAGLPIYEADFEALRAYETIRAADSALAKIETYEQDLPSATLKDSLPLLSGPPSEARTAEVTRLKETLTTAADRLDARIAIATQKKHELETKLATYDATKAKAQALIAANPGNDPQAVLIREDAQRIIEFVDRERAQVERTHAALTAEIDAATTAGRMARAQFGAIATLVSDGQPLLAKRATLRADVQAYTAKPGNTAPISAEPFELHAAALKTRLEALHQYRITLLNLETTDPAGLRALESSGALAVVSAEIAATEAEFAATVQDALALHAAARHDKEAKATLVAKGASDFADTAGKKLETGTDAELDKLAAAHDPYIKALEAELTTLEADRKAARAVIEKYKGRDEATLSVPELMEKQRAVMTLAGGVLGEDGRPEMSLDDRIKGLGAVLAYAQQSKAIITQRRTALATNLEQKLGISTHPTAESQFPPGSQEDLWAKMDALSTLYGIPVEAKPEKGEPFNVTYKRVTAFIQKVEAAQGGSYMLLCYMLKNDLGIDPGVKWVTEGDSTHPDLPRMGGKPPPAPIDWAKFKEDDARVRALAAKALGIPEAELNDPKSILTLSKMSRRESDASQVDSPFNKVTTKLFESRGAMPRTYLDALAIEVTAKYTTPLTNDLFPATIPLADLKKWETDLSLPLAAREAARAIGKNPELQKALGIPPATGVSVDKLRALEKRATSYYVPDPSGKGKPYLARQIPLQLFYAGAAADATKLKSLLAAEDYNGVRTLLEGLSYDHRQMLLIEYAGQNGQEALMKDIGEAFGGEKLGWVLAIIDQRDLKTSADFYDQLISWDPKKNPNQRWPDSSTFGELAGKTITREDFEKWSAGLQFEDFDRWLDLYDTQFRGGVSGILYGMSGTRPPDELIESLKKRVGESRTEFTKYLALKKAAEEKEAAALALNQTHTDPARAELLLAEATKLKDQAAAQKRLACYALARASQELELMQSGSKHGTEKGIRIAQATYEISKSVTIAAAATAGALAFPPLAGVAAGSVAGIAGGIALGTAAGTTLAFGFAALEERNESGAFNWDRVGKKTAAGAGEALMSAATAGIPLGAVHKAGQLAMAGNRFASVMMKSMVLRTAFIATTSAVTTMGATYAQYGINKKWGDAEAAEKIKEGMWEGGARAFVGALLMAPWAHKVTGGLGVAVNAGFGGAEQATVNWIKGRPWHEGLAQSVISSAVMGMVFEASHHMNTARQVKALKPGETPLVRLPGEKATVEPSWKIAEIKADGTIRLTKDGAKPVDIMAGKLVAANKPLERAIQDFEAKQYEKPDPAADRLRALIQPGDVVTLNDKGKPFQGKVVGFDDHGGVIIERAVDGKPVNEVHSLQKVGEALQLMAPPGVESKLVPGMLDAEGGQARTIAAMDAAMANGGQVSLATVDVHRFKEVGNVGGDHSVGDAYIKATGRQLEAQLRAAGFKDVVVSHQGSKSFRVMYSGDRHADFAKAMQSILGSEAFKTAVFEDVKANVTPSQAKKLKPPSEINTYVGVATEPNPPGTKGNATDAVRALYEHSFEASKVAQLDHPNVKGTLTGEEAQKLIELRKAEKRDSFAIYDPAAVERLRGAGEAYTKELTTSVTLTEVHEALAAAGLDISKLSQDQRLSLLLDGIPGTPKTSSGKRILSYGLFDEFDRQITKDLAEGKGMPVDLIFASKNGDEIRVLRVERDPTTGELVKRVYTADVNDFGALNTSAGPKTADGVKRVAIEAIDGALNDTTKPFGEALRDAAVKMTTETLADPAFALKGKVEPGVSGFKSGKLSLKEGVNYAVGAEGTLNIGGLSYEAKVVADPAGGKTPKMQLSRDGKLVMLVDFTATPSGKAIKLSLILPDNRTTLSLGGFSLRASELEPPTETHGTRLKAEALEKIAPDVAAEIKKANAKTKEPNNEGFIAALTDAYAEHLKQQGKAAAIADGTGKYSPEKFVGALDLETMAKDPTFRAKFKELIREVYARDTKRLPKSGFVTDAVTQYKGQAEAAAWFKSLDPSKPNGGLDAAAQKKAPQHLADTAGVPLVKPEAIAGKDVRTVELDATLKPGENGGDAYAKFHAEILGAKLLGDQGLGPKVIGVVDRGDGKLVYVLEPRSPDLAPPHERMMNMRDPVTVKGTFDALSLLRQNGLDVRGELKLLVDKDGRVSIDPSTIVPYDPARALPLSEHLRTLRLSTFGEPLAQDLSPAKIAERIGKDVPETQRAGLEAQLAKLDPSAKISLVKDPSGLYWLIDSKPLADGGWQWTARSVDQRGATLNVISERFSDNATRTGAARAELPPGVLLTDLRNALPEKPTPPVSTKNSGEMAKVSGFADKIDRALKGVKAGEIGGKAHEDSGRLILDPNPKKAPGSTFDHGKELRVSKESIQEHVIKPLEEKLANKNLMAKLSPDERAYLEAVLARAKAAVELCDFGLHGGPMPKTLSDGLTRYNAKITAEQKAFGEKASARLDVVETVSFPTPLKQAPLDAPAKIAKALDVPMIAADKATSGTVRLEQPGPKGYSEDQYRQFAKDVAAAKLLSDLGGPRFLGVLETKDGRLAIVTERLVPFEGTLVTPELLSQVKPQLEALRNAGYDVDGYRLMKTADGRVVIDRASIVQISTGATPHDFGVDVMRLYVSSEGEVVRGPGTREQVWGEAVEGSGWAKSLPKAQLAAAQGLIANTPAGVDVSIGKSETGRLVFIESQIGTDGTHRWRQRTINPDGSLGEAKFFAMTREGKPAETPPFGVLRDDGMTIRGFGADGFEHTFEVRRETKLGPPPDPATFPVLTEAKIAELKEQFQKHVDRNNYNDAAPTLEFMAFYRDAKKANPKLTITQAFAMFNLDGGAAVNKYNGGNCFSLAENFNTLLKAQGIEGYMVGQQGINAALVMPDGSQRWGALGYIDRAHGSLLVPYKTPSGEVRYLHFETGVGHDVPPKTTTPKQLERQAYAKPDQPILNGSEILRNRMRMLNSMVISDITKKPSPTLKINMVDGTIVLRNVDGMKLAPGETQLKVDFVKLMESGDPTKVIELLTIAQKELNQPPSFVQDMLTLMESRVSGEYKQLMFEDSQHLYDEADAARHGGGT